MKQALYGEIDCALRSTYKASENHSTISLIIHRMFRSERHIKYTHETLLRPILDH